MPLVHALHKLAVLRKAKGAQIAADAGAKNAVLQNLERSKGDSRLI